MPSNPESVAWSVAVVGVTSDDPAPPDDSFRIGVVWIV